MTWAPLSVLPAIRSLSCSRNSSTAGQGPSGARKPISHNTVRQLILWYALGALRIAWYGAVQHFRWPDTVRHSRTEAFLVRARPNQNPIKNPPSRRKAAIAKLVQPPQADIDDDADDR